VGLKSSLSFISWSNANPVVPITQVYLREPCSLSKTIEHILLHRNGKPIVNGYLIDDSTIDTHPSRYVFLRDKEGSTSTHVMMNETLRQ